VSAPRLNDILVGGTRQKWFFIFFLRLLKSMKSL
jgi:hypothetical protein